ncbi:MAG: DNA repair protein RecN [Lachnospiraceae bacterium]|nr:DNA repair protein RecN [Lachnospiraceae bacterium]
MLNYLHVKNIALLRDVEMNFDEGLCVLSGETGAGKSILLHAILLALGARTDTGLIRTGADEASIELILQANEPETLDELQKLGIETEEGQIVLQRKIAEKKSIAKINGETVPASLLRKAASLFIDLYGQREHESLLDENNHLSALDAYGSTKIDEALSEYRTAYDSYREKKEEIRKLGTDDEERKRRIDYLTYTVREIENAHLKPGEEEDLKEKRLRFMKAEELSKSLKEAEGYLSQNAQEALSGAVSALKKAAETDKEIETIFRTLVDADAIVRDAESEIEERIAALPSEEEEAGRIEERLDEIQRLRRKYGGSAEEILASLKQYRSELDELRRLDANKEQLYQELEERKERLKEAGRSLHLCRSEAAVRFDRDMTAALSELRFLSVVFRTEVTETNRFTRNGADTVVFYISMNPGETPKPLSQIASGGELSRIMLALKTLSSQKGSEKDKTFIFDEIDTGISGSTALAVARRLMRASEDRQVLLVSHLPQIVAMADHNYLIEKNVYDNETVTAVRELSEEESLSEIARLLGTGEMTDAALRNAKELRSAVKG